MGSPMSGKPLTPGFTARQRRASAPDPLPRVPAPQPDPEPSESVPPVSDVPGRARLRRDALFPGGRAIILFAAAYAAAYACSNAFGSTVPAPFWAPDAALLCTLLLTRRRTWSVYLLLALPIRLALEWRWTLSIGFLLQ